MSLSGSEMYKAGLCAFEFSYMYSFYKKKLTKTSNIWSNPRICAFYHKSYKASLFLEHSVVEESL